MNNAQIELLLSCIELCVVIEDYDHLSEYLDEHWNLVSGNTDYH